MKFSRDITHEEMTKIANGDAVVYVLTSGDNDHGLVDKHLYRVMPVEVAVDGIGVEPKTGEWYFQLRNPKYQEYKIYPTLKDVNEYIKSISKFWEVGSYNEVIGWNKPEAVVLEAKQHTEKLAYVTSVMNIEPPVKDWKAFVKAGQRELQFLDKERYEKSSSELKAYEERARKHYNDDSPL